MTEFSPSQNDIADDHACSDCVYCFLPHVAVHSALLPCVRPLICFVVFALQQSTVPLGLLIFMLAENNSSCKELSYKLLLLCLRPHRAKALSDAYV